MAKFEVPIIDISALVATEGEIESKRQTALKIGAACRDVGFFIITGHGVEDKVISDVWDSTSKFFDLPVEDKMTYTKPQHIYPFGYSPLGAEALSKGKRAEFDNSDEPKFAPPDLKELFSLGPDNPVTMFPPREFPQKPSHFESSWTLYYSTLNKLANQILVAFAIALGLEENYFQSFVAHHASALRAINYPAVDPSLSALLPNQLRASAHTDYGTITILNSDGPGLQVSKDKDPPSWVDVPFVQGSFIINLGDLMRRWTNDLWLSTLHRVVIVGDGEDTAAVCRRRQSLAFFHNIDRTAVVQALLLQEGDTAKYEPIVAGDFLMQKHLASLGEQQQEKS